MCPRPCLRRITAAPPPSQEETVKPVLKDKTDAAVEVIIKGDTDVKDALAKALLANYAELTAEQIAAIDWQYECEGSGKHDKVGVISNTAWGPVDKQFTSIKTVTIIWDFDITCYHNPLIEQKNDTSFKVCIGSDTANYREITKVDKYSTRLVLKENASITYTMVAAAEKEAIGANGIASGSTVRPAGTTAADFTVERDGKLFGWGWDEIPDAKLDAGDGQDIRIKYNGNDTYKASDKVKATINVAKATLKETVTPNNTL